MTKSHKLFEVLQWAFSFLKKHHREEKIAEILLMHHLSVSRATLFSMMQDVVSDDIIQKFKNDIIRHTKTGIPVQHLTGLEHFYGRKFLVNEHVLVPRFETEELVQHVISTVNKTEPITIIDVGTGSGVIAITLALELPNANVYATDISVEALKIAKENAKLQKASITFLEGDFLQPVIDMQINPQLIVSNPPYISESEKDTLSDTVKNYDPALALFATDNGLAAYKKIVKQLKQLHVHSICFEIGSNQAEQVTDIIKEQFGNSTVSVIQDINGKDRIISARLLSS